MTDREHHTYEIYGLILAADSSLGDLPIRRTDRTPPDVTIELDCTIEAPGEDAVPLFTTTIGGEELRVFREDNGWLWLYPDDTRFWVSPDAGRVRCSRPAHFSVEDVVTYLLGPIMGFVLRQRGVVCLHASTLSIGGTGLSILGPAGAGKSTLTAALVSRGHRLVAEDVSALSREPWRVASGLPFIKLWPDSAGLHGELPTLTPNWDKRFLAVRSASGEENLSALLFLETGPSVSLSPVDSRDALVGLVDNVYVPYSLAPADRASDLDYLAGLAESVPARIATRTDAYEDLPELCRLIEALAEEL